jgi:hypothetical protein
MSDNYNLKQETRKQSQACERSVRDDGLDIGQGLRQKFSLPFIFSISAIGSTNRYCACLSFHLFLFKYSNKIQYLAVKMLNWYTLLYSGILPDTPIYNI